ncbi:immunoglobulin domain-containing protein [Aquimarina sp. MMG016]|uniref:immunoglobulin domain-containing protein n=1 Tax=Aquimarina sp. MMG016 TaxID=2822690 RepID=UPI001B39EBFE|nr:immunoglobulin domain-containing protein [Aquimarina sp. MMG016]MBQ4820656.1 immunoglobulin domain-containing protein [Aquimarina sp. MMG016]
MKNIKSHKSVVLTLLIAIFSLGISKAQVSQAERQALIDLYNATYGDQWKNTVANNKTWQVQDPTSDVSSWYGITVANGTVTAIKLANNGLSGALPNSIGNLSGLKSLYLEQNTISGTIPESIGSLSNLMFVVMRNNQLSGAIPPSIWNLSNLVTVALQNNQLSGGLPDIMLPLTGLKFLNLSNNNLTGTIPSVIGNFSSLINFNMAGNRFSGVLPESLSNLGNIATISLNSNQFIGQLPDFTSITSLKNLYIQQNHFVFADFETQFAAYQNNLTAFQYGPQKKADTPIDQTVSRGGSITLTSSLNSTNNNYQWYKNGIAINDANNKDLALSNADNNSAGTYKVRATNNAIPNLTIERNNIALTVTENNNTNEVSQAEREALIDLYNATNGSNWKNTLAGDQVWQINDPDSDVSTWFGVTVVDGKVTGISLQNNSLQGEIPSSIDRFSVLRVFNVSNNQLEGDLPYFTIDNVNPFSSFSELYIANNKYSFSDLDSNFGYFQGNLVVFEYIPQAKVDQEETLSVTTGGSITLTSSQLVSSNNTYQWFKDGVAIAGATSKDLIISDAKSTDAGVYTFNANNSVINDLTLERNTITLTVTPGNVCAVSTQERQALVDFYNATNGDQWKNTTEDNNPWLVNDPNSSVCDWFGVKVENDVIVSLELPDNNLTGTLPVALFQLKQLRAIVLQNNNLSGKIPTAIGELTALVTIFLANNNLNGEIPKEIGSLNSLTILWLSNNSFEGEIPKELGNLPVLTIIALANNRLEGTIPVGLSESNSLHILLINNNQLSGPLPIFNRILALGTTPSSNIFGEGYLNIKNNKFIYSNFENEFNTYKNAIGTNFIYTPQAKVDQEETSSIATGGTITLTSNQLISPNNSYQWFKDGVAITGATSKDYVISDAKATDAGVYTFEAGNGIIKNPDLILERNPITLTIDTANPCNISPSERQALIDFYNATNGDQWKNTVEGNQPWLINDPNSSVCDWFGVIIDTDGIMGLLLSDNNLQGYLPASMSVLNLGSLILDNNKISGSIPQEWASINSLRGLLLSHNELEGRIAQGFKQKLTFLWIDNNKFIFSDFESEFDYYQGLGAPNFIYSNQAKVDQQETISVTQGESITLTTNKLVSLNNTYQWFKDGVAITGATSKDYTILEATATDEGVYTFEATNTIIDNLTLERNPITLSIGAGNPCDISPSEREVLIDFYNATNGSKWKNTVEGNKPWLVNDPDSSVCDWHGVTVENGKVIKLDLNSNEVAGELPGSLGSLSNLTDLLLGNNNLTGSIPVELGQMSSLETLYLSSNQLSESIPSALGNLSSLIFLGLESNELSGSIPVELTTIPALSHVILRDNRLSGKVPNFSHLPSNQGSITGFPILTIDQNEFVFSDFETEFNTYLNKWGNLFQYKNQAKVDEPLSPSVVEKESITLTSIELSSPNNRYQWYKDGIIIPGATNKNLVITDAKDTDGGVYIFKATNSVVTGLTLERHPITLFIAPENPCDISEAQRSALIDFYNATNGDQWKNTIAGNQPWLINDRNSSVCDWYGIEIFGGKVTKIDLNNNGLTGSIPASINNLPYLKTLYLFQNSISESIPETIGELPELLFFMAYGNQLTGNIPNSIQNLKNLRTLSLQSNQLQGTIPDVIWDLESLVSLALQNNQFTGGIPKMNQPLQNLKFLNLSKNALTGEIPDKLAFCPALVFINLGENQLSGEIPVEIGNLQNLKTLSLHDNEFTGSIPDGFENLPNLIGLNVLGNNLSGKIPDFTTNVTLQNLYVQKNGFIFSDFETEFVNYQMQLNDFFYSPQSKVDQEETISVIPGQEITLTTNQLTSSNNIYKWCKDGVEIAGETSKNLVISNLSSADAGVYTFKATNSIVGNLELERNPITLVFDTCAVSQKERQALVDLYNATNGLNWTNNNNWNTDTPVCSWYGVTVREGKVVKLELANNNVSGTIPASIGNLTALEELHLFINQLSGTVPIEIGQLKELQILALSNNQLEGTIPVGIGQFLELQFLVLGGNRFSGTIPMAFENLQKLQYADFANNNLHGRIPPGLAAIETWNGGLGISNNKFIFSDFEDEFDTYKSKLGSSFFYSPQAKVDQEESIAIDVGSTITLTSNVLTSPNNTYQWFKDGVEIPDAINKDLIISNITNEDAGIYTLEAKNTVVKDLTLIRNPITLTIGTGNPCDVSQQERQALIELYNATNGDNWENTVAGNKPWMINDPNSSVCDWYGVKVVNGSVDELQLEQNNLEGTLPPTLDELRKIENLYLNENKISGSIPELGRLLQLRELYLHNNQLTGTIPQSLAQLEYLDALLLDHNRLSGRVPNFTIINDFTDFYISNNEFIFSDFESEFEEYKNKLALGFQYIPQAKVDTEETITVFLGGNITLTSNQLTSFNNTYQWYKDGVAIPDATDKDLIISNVSDNDAGVYHFLATNSIIKDPDLILERNPITLTIGTPGGDCTNLLETIGVDTSFESALPVVANGRNETLGATGWEVGQGTPDTFLAPLTNTGDELLLYGFQNSPNGGVCAGALRAGDATESFYADIAGLYTGVTYIVEFYQANTTNLLIPEFFDEAYGYWNVSFGNESQNSDELQPVPSQAIWQRTRLEFTPISASQRIEFSAGSRASDESNAYPVYMLIDGIRIYQKPLVTDNTSCFEISTQLFCSIDIEEPTIADLTSPLTGTTSWYSEQVGGTLYATNTDLTDLPSYFVWADNGSDPRVPVEIIFDWGAPKGDDNQYFDIYDNPTIENLKTEEDVSANISWYSTARGTTPLDKTTPLVNGTTYYAAKGNNSCRLEVLALVQVPQPDGDGFQEFCSTEDPTIADLYFEVTNPNYTLKWYVDATGTQTYPITTPLEDNKTYYVVQTNGTVETPERFPVNVGIIDVAGLGRTYTASVLLPLESKVSALSDFYFNTNKLWYAQAIGGVAINPETRLEEGTYYTRLGGQPCDASEVLAVTVRLGEVGQPERITCIKYLPRPGDEYVISGWVREEKLKTVDSETVAYSTVSDQFVNLLTHLKDKVINKEPIPSQYVLKDDKDFKYDVDGLLPFIKGSKDRNVTVYDFKLIKENIDNIKRTIGFSFSLDENNKYKFTYITPRVRFQALGYTFRRGFHFPLLYGKKDNPAQDNVGITITFKKAEPVGNSFQITSDFKIIKGGSPFYQQAFTNHVSERSTTSGISSEVDFFTYEEDPTYQVTHLENTSIELLYKDIDQAVIPPQDVNDIVFTPKGSVIDGWQRISASFKIPENAANLTITLKNKGTDINAYFDDVRVHPFDSSMKTFVYDPLTQRLQAELDDNNYATFYEYDAEGGLVRVKKETERGVYTIQETRSNSAILND